MQDKNPTELTNQIILGDCIKFLPEYFHENYFDMIIGDLPYGTTKNKWDSVLDINKLWVNIKRLRKENAVSILFGQDKFTAKMMLSNEREHRYNLIWEKIDRPTGFLNANRMPLRSHEDIMVFYGKLPIYNPQWTIGNKNHTRGHSRGKKQTNNCYGNFKPDVPEILTNQKYPRSILKFRREHPPIHPTQKPILLYFLVFIWKYYFFKTVNSVLQTIHFMLIDFFFCRFPNVYYANNKKYS